MRELQIDFGVGNRSISLQIPLQEIEEEFPDIDFKEPLDGYTKDQLTEYLSNQINESEDASYQLDIVESDTIRILDCYTI